MGRYERFDTPGRAPRWRAARRPRRRRLPFGVYVALTACLTFAIVFAAPDIVRTPASSPAAETATASGEASTGRFGLCGAAARINCVVDGDTFWIDGEKVRILDIDTPELHPARCAEEERLGLAAKHRLHALLNGGELRLHRAGDRDRDRYGRMLRTASVDGRDVGDVLIAEGLARPYGGGRRSWC
ncbi:MAG: thermonuclease family protein [Parasphingopyxis sp.]|nr:thermonuclease family protein [Sphingomonadales bacterium]